MKKIIAAILLCATLCVMFIGCAQGTYNGPAETVIITVPAETNNGGGVGLVVDKDAADDKLETEAEKVDGIAIPGWGALTIPAGQTENIVANFNNPSENAGKYYLTFELSLLNADGSKGEVLYKSNLIEPGKYIQTIKLNRALEAGEYEANMFVQPYKMSDKTPTNNLNSKMKLIVVSPKSAS